MPVGPVAPITRTLDPAIAVDTVEKRNPELSSTGLCFHSFVFSLKRNEKGIEAWQHR